MAEIDADRPLPIAARPALERMAGEIATFSLGKTNVGGLY